MEEEGKGYEPVNQLYTVKTRADGAASKWQVDTGDIRRFLEEKIKGYVRRETEYFEYEIIDTVNKVPVSRFVERTDKDAQAKLVLYCEAMDLKFENHRLQPTGETEYRETMTRERKPLLPDDVADSLLLPIETTFSHVGYLTKYTTNNVKDEVYRNIVAIRQLLANQCMIRGDIEVEHLEVTINLIKNMMYQVLRASEDGWTGNRMSDITTEKIITDTSNKRGIMSLG